MYGYLLTGAMQYNKNGLNTSTPKLKVIDLIKDNVIDGIDDTTAFSKTKFNVMVWEPYE